MKACLPSNQCTVPEKTKLLQVQIRYKKISKADTSLTTGPAIAVKLQIRIQHTIGTRVTFRNLKQVNPEEFLSVLYFGNIDNCENLTSASDTYEKELRRVLDQLAPKKTKLLIKKEKRPWYDEEVAIMKRALRRSEKIWIRNSYTICWKAYQQVRKLYQSKIVKRKIKTISIKIEEWGHDTEKYSYS